VNTISLLSYAKVNFGLRILRRRPDGFHDIETVLQTIDLQDQVHITSAAQRQIEVCCDHPQVPGGAENLAFQAAALLQREYPRCGGCHIEIHKKIPPAAGLGGGSSNAGATLLGLNQLWNLKLSQEKLTRLASHLGSDVPFFLEGGTALAQGRGEILRPVALLPDFWLVLVKPKLAISTRWAYSQVRIPLTSNSRCVKLNSFKTISHLRELLSLLQNDLEEAVKNTYPVIGEVKSELLSQGAMGAAMSGSGSAVFGIVETHRDARMLADKMRSAEWQTFIVRPVRRCKIIG
jgi:4-diphosphocytidyl-2-C-methyl-D-erythritol kinase